MEYIGFRERKKCRNCWEYGILLINFEGEYYGTITIGYEAFLTEDPGYNCGSIDHTYRLKWDLLNFKYNQGQVLNDEESKAIIGNPDIIGKWEVVESTKLPFGHPSFCKSLNLKSIFEFEKNGVLKVYEKLGIDNCNQDQTYKVVGSTISMLEGDMFFDYKIIRLTKDTLKIDVAYEDAKITLIKLN